MNKREREAMDHKDVLGAGAKKRKKLSGLEKINVVMAEFRRGTLHSSDGSKVTDPKMAYAIAMSEARRKARG